MLMLYKTILYKNNKKLILSHKKFKIVSYSFDFFFKGMDKRLLIKELKSFLFKFNFLVGKKKIRFYPIKIKKRLTLNKSPFINKRSKDQFEVRCYSLKLSYFFKNKSYFLFIKNKIHNLFLTKNNNLNFPLFKINTNYDVS